MTASCSTLMCWRRCRTVQPSHGVGSVRLASSTRATSWLISASAVGASYMPFVMVVMIGGSAGFASPIGYQTHLMVYGPGGYRFTDFARIGVPLGLVLAAVVIGLAPLIWPF